MDYDMQLLDRSHDFNLTPEQRKAARDERRARLIERTGRTASDGTWMPYTNPPVDPKPQTSRR